MSGGRRVGGRSCSCMATRRVRRCGRELLRGWLGVDVEFALSVGFFFFFFFEVSVLGDFEWLRC